MSSEIDGYGTRVDQSDIDRLLEDCRTLAPSGIERIARGWMTLVGAGWAENVSGHKGASSVDHDAWHEAERAALHVLETTNRAPAWDTLRNRILELTERHDAMVAWREEHGEAGHRAEDALLGAALALCARPGLDMAREASDGETRCHSPGNGLLREVGRLASPQRVGATTAVPRACHGRRLTFELLLVFRGAGVRRAQRWRRQRA